MKNEERAGFLLSELGQIDDRFLNESSDDALIALRAARSNADRCARC